MFVSHRGEAMPSGKVVQPYRGFTGRLLLRDFACLQWKRKEEQAEGKAYGGGAGINAGDVYEGSRRVPSNKAEEPDPLA